MAGVRSSDPKGGIVPYSPASNPPPSGNNPPSSGNNNTKSSKGAPNFDARKGNGLAVYDGYENVERPGSGTFTERSNYTAGPGDYGPSVPGNDFGPGGGPTSENGFGPFSQNAPQRSQPGGTATGYPVIDGAGPGGPGGAYVARPVPVSRRSGPEPTGPQQNGWITGNGPANYQLEKSGKTFNAGGGGDYGPHGYGGQNDSLSGYEKHHHHHYYYTNNQHHPVPYNNGTSQAEKRRRRGTGALVAALIACWACTCCCHVPCGC